MSKVDRQSFDRRLYTAAAIAFSLIVFLGFARTYYLKGFFDSPALPSRLVHVHALVMTFWLVLFVVQVRLVASKRRALHERLGYAGIALGALLIATGIPTALQAAKYGTGVLPPGVTRLGFLAVPLMDLVVFALLFGGAVYFRRRPAAHKSLMLLTAVNFLPPALGRIPFVPLQSLGPAYLFGIPLGLAVLCLVMDARRNGRINKVFAIATALLAVSFGVRIVLVFSASWARVAEWLIRSV